MAVGAGDRAGQAEVGDLDPVVVGEQDVLGLDVAVHQAGLVGGAERGEHRLEHLERLARAEVALGPDQVAQGAPADELHREEDVPLVGALVVDGDHVGVGQPGRRVRLADEPGDELLVVGQARVHHLERDRAVETVVVGLVDRGHPAPRQPGTDVVAPIEQLPDEGVADSRVHGASLRGTLACACLGRAAPAYWKRALRASTLSTYRRVSGYIPRSRTERRPW